MGKRQIQYDLNKNCFNILKESDSDIIIIDLIDERYDIFKVGDTCFTKSNLFNKVNFNSNKEISVINRNSKEIYDLWIESVDVYIKKLKKLGKKVIIHRAFWKDQYVNNTVNKSISTKTYLNNLLYSLYYGNRFDCRNKIRKFNKRTQSEIKINNNILDNYYKSFIKEKEFCFIDILKDFKADRGHKWGLAPFHYETGYYIEFMNILDGIINGK